MRGVAVDGAVEDELVGRGTGEGEAEFRAAWATQIEREGVLLFVGGEAVVGEGVAHGIDGAELIAVEENAAPARGVGEKRRPLVAVDRELFDIPDAVEGGLRDAGAELFPADARTPDVGRDEPESEDHPHSKCNAIGAERAEEWRT